MDCRGYIWCSDAHAGLKAAVLECRSAVLSKHMPPAMTAIKTMFVRTEPNACAQQWDHVAEIRPAERILAECPEREQRSMIGVHNPAGRWFRFSIAISKASLPGSSLGSYRSTSQDLPAERSPTSIPHSNGSSDATSVIPLFCKS